MMTMLAGIVLMVLVIAIVVLFLISNGLGAWIRYRDRRSYERFLRNRRPT